METYKKSNAVIIGLKFSIKNILLTITGIVPIIGIIPSVILEEIVSKIIDEKPYSRVCTIVIIVQFLATIIYLFLVKYIVSKQTLIKDLDKNDIYKYMIGFQFFICGLAFCLKVAIFDKFVTDGQSVLNLYITHPAASLAFIPFGIFIELSKNKKRLYIEDN